MKGFLFSVFMFSLILVSAGSEITYSLTVNQGEEVSTYVPPVTHQLYRFSWVLVAVFLVLAVVRLGFAKKLFKKKAKRKVRRRARKKRR